MGELIIEWYESDFKISMFSGFKEIKWGIKAIREYEKTCTFETGKSYGNHEFSSWIKNLM